MSVSLENMAEESKRLVIREFQKRIKDQYPPAMDLVRSSIQGNRVRIDFNRLLKNMRGDVLLLLESQGLQYGLDDPALVAQLPPLPKNALRPLAIVEEGQLVTYGVKATQRHVVVKLSEVKDRTALKLLTGAKKRIPLQLLGTDREWDLALLELAGERLFSPVQWPANEVPIRAGTGLMSPDTVGRFCWGVASDTRRPIQKPVSQGPGLDPAIISTYRAPYPSVIRHDLPLFARDAGRPVYDLEGRLVGLHMGRLCRTQGLIVGIQDVRRSVHKILAATKKNADVTSVPLTLQR